MGLLQFFSHRECQDDSCQNCEEMPKFIKVTAKNIAGTFFSGHGVYSMFALRQNTLTS